MDPLLPPHRFLQGLSLYRSGRYWEAHEAWEDLWRVASGKERDFYQGLIQIAAALLHVQKEHWSGVENLLDKARAHIEKSPSPLFGVDMRPLKEEISRCRAEVEAVRNGQKSAFDWSLRPMPGRNLDMPELSIDEQDSPF